jgi:hypothetical protein
MQHALDSQLERIGRKLKVLVLLVVFKEKEEVAI